MISRDAWMLAVQMVVNEGWDLEIADLTAAFTQGAAIHRDQGEVYCNQPLDGIAGLHPEQLLRVV